MSTESGMEENVAEKSIFLDLTPAVMAKDEILKEYASFLTYEITDENGASFAIESGKAINGKLKILDDQRKAITKPLDDAKAMVMGIYKPAISRLEQVQSILKAAIIRYRQEQERRRIELQRQAEARARKEEEDRRRELAEQAEQQLKEGKSIAAMETVARAESVVVIPERIAPPEAPRGAQIRKNWKARVVDPDAVPLKFLMPNERALATHAKQFEDKSPVPGVEFYNDAGVAFVTVK